jgi:DNA-binding CsgD family transcriptional regulator
VILDEEEYLSHYGMPRRSGRYAWGSTGNVPQRNKEFLDYIKELLGFGMSEVEIARGMGISTTQLRARRSIAKTQQRLDTIHQVELLKERGHSNVAIGERLGIPESTVRSYLADGAKDKAKILTATADMLRQHVADKKYIDVGAGVEHHIGISATKLKNAVAILKEEGYRLHYLKVPQLGTRNQYTSVKVLTSPDTEYSELFKNQHLIQQINSHTLDSGRSFYGLHDPLPINPKRVAVRYAEDGGGKTDGVIYVRPGVQDVSLGKSSYAQVRVKVGDGHYLKGMAMYSNDLPEGVDLLFNTSKSSTGNDLDAMKELSDDPDNPFGAIIKADGQQVKQNEDGSTEVTSVMNAVNEEGDWQTWSKNLSSQMLSKQPPALAKSQLNMTFEKQKHEFEEIMSLTNPVVRQKLLEGFASGADSAAVHLKAAALKGQGTHAILPVESMPPTQIYAPNYEDGEKVVLIRYPHGGTFEIPELTVNNKHKEAKQLLGQARDAVGIHHTVAERLSGADFDGDTVLVIPNKDGKVQHSPALEELKDFDPRALYKLPDDVEGIDDRRKQRLMGEATNLVADMTIQAASPSEIARAVKHTMVVIDAEKHRLDVKQSAIDQNITQLKTKYQGGPRAGAATLITRARSRTDVPAYKPRLASEGGPINKETGALEFVPTNETKINKDGEEVLVTKQSRKLDEEADAYALSSGTRIESIYADHSNKLKALANSARLEMIKTEPTPYSSSARKAYDSQVRSLVSKLVIAERNKPLERQAQLLANAVYRSKLQENRYMDSDRKKKIKYQALEEARTRTGAKKNLVDIEPDEWDAIQAGAVTPTRLRNILNNSDLDAIKKLATPSQPRTVTPAKLARAQRMLASGYTRAEIARALGIALGTLDEALYS